MAPSATEPMQTSVIICGRGIGGLACALALEARGIRDMRICEGPGPALAEHDCGVVLDPSVVEMLHQLHLMEEVVAAGTAPTQLCHFATCGNPLTASPLGLAAKPDKFPQVRPRPHSTDSPAPPGPFKRDRGTDSFMRALPPPVSNERLGRPTEQ